MQKLEENAKSLGRSARMRRSVRRRISASCSTFSSRCSRSSWQTNRTQRGDDEDGRGSQHADLPEPRRPRGVPPDVALGRIPGPHRQPAARSRTTTPRCSRSSRSVCTRCADGDGVGARSLDHPVRQQHGQQRRAQQRSAAAGADRPRRRRQGQPAPALPAGHAAREHPGHHARPRGRAGEGHREVRRQHRRRSRKCDHEALLDRSHRAQCRWSPQLLASPGRADSDRPAAAGRGPARRSSTAGRPKEDVNRRNADGSTPLQWAVYDGDVAEVKRLLRAGADVVARQPLRRHADEPRRRGRQHRDARRCCSRPARTPTRPNADGQTALLAVARTGNVEGRAAAARARRHRRRARDVRRTDRADVGVRAPPSGDDAVADRQGRRRQRALDGSRLPASRHGRGTSEEPGQRRA